MTDADASVLRSALEAACNEECSCGGSSPVDPDCCSACRIWHAMISELDARETDDTQTDPCPRCTRLAAALRKAARYNRGCTDSWCWCDIPGDHSAWCHEILAVLNDVGDIPSSREARLAAALRDISEYLEAQHAVESRSYWGLREWAERHGLYIDDLGEQCAFAKMAGVALGFARAALNDVGDALTAEERSDVVIAGYCASRLHEVGTECTKKLLAIIDRLAPAPVSTTQSNPDPPSQGGMK